MDQRNQEHICSSCELLNTTEQMKESIFRFHTQTVFAKLGKTNNLCLPFFFSTEKENVAGPSIHMLN